MSQEAFTAYQINSQKVIIAGLMVAEEQIPAIEIL